MAVPIARDKIIVETRVRKQGLIGWLGQYNFSQIDFYIRQAVPGEGDQNLIREFVLSDSDHISLRGKYFFPNPNWLVNWIFPRIFDIIPVIDRCGCAPGSHTLFGGVRVAHMIGLALLILIEGDIYKENLELKKLTTIFLSGTESLLNIPYVHNLKICYRSTSTPCQSSSP